MSTDDIDIRRLISDIAEGSIRLPQSLTEGTKGGENLYKDHVVRIVSERIHFSQADVAKVLDAVVDVIGDSISSGRSVSLPNFGRFLLKKKAAKGWKHPRTGERMEAPERYIPHFEPAKGPDSLRQRIDPMGRSVPSALHW